MLNQQFFSVFVAAGFLSSAAAAVGGSSNDCVYTFYVQTGSGISAGTDSKISLTASDSNGRSVWVPDLERWGLMGLDHDYFERGNLDIFTGRGPCVGRPICRLNITSDGSGAHHGWFCDYVEVTSTGPHRKCSQSIFYVERWLAEDAPPYHLTAVVDGCHDGKESRPTSGNTGPFVVRKPIGSASELFGL